MVLNCGWGYIPIHFKEARFFRPLTCVTLTAAHERGTLES